MTMITVSENAKERAIMLMKQENRPIDSFIRVGVEGGGCSGLSYKLEFDDQVKEGDQVFTDKGIKIAVDKKSFLYLIGTELDYTGGLNGKGFTFINPNATRTCGCGESFSV
jgi:iron-sulfur cluster assembly protein